MVDFDDDWLTFSHLAGIRDALEKELLKRNLPECCFTGVVPGNLVAVDFVEDGCGGMAWVRLTGAFPSLHFPEPDATPEPALVMAYGIEIGIMRPIEVPDNGDAPDESTQFEAARLQAADMAAMLAVLCAYPDANSVPIVIGSYTPVGPAGAAVGGSWLATLGQVY